MAYMTSCLDNYNGLMGSEEGSTDLFLEMGYLEKESTDLSPATSAYLIHYDVTLPLAS
jgi:hypothetical protein